MSRAALVISTVSGELLVNEPLSSVLGALQEAFSAENFNRVSMIQVKLLGGDTAYIMAHQITSIVDSTPSGWQKYMKLEMDREIMNLDYLRIEEE